MRFVTGGTVPGVALLTDRTPGTGKYLSASGAVKSSSGGVWAFTVNPIASQSWSLYLYDNTSGSGTVIYQISGISGTTTEPVSVSFSTKLKATTGIYATLTQATASFIFE